MPKYGNEYYGLGLYGTDTLVDYDASPFTASSTTHNEIFLEWNLPTGDWDKIRLVRNTFGFPMTPDDGDLLFEAANTTNERSYTDNGQVPNDSGLLLGQLYYYSIFVRNSGDLRWIKAGNAVGLSVNRYGIAELMYDYLPNVMRVNNIYESSSNDSEVNSDLYNFLKIFAFEYEYFKTMAENIKNRYDVLRLDGRLIPAMLNQFGFNYEPEIGIQQARVLLQNAIKIYSLHGSKAGIETFVTAFTGYNCEIGPVKNLMLDLNSSSFRETTGFWENKANTTIARGTATSETPAIAPYEEPLSPSNFPNSSVGYMKLTAIAAGDMEITCGAASPLKRGIPVTEGTTYTLTAFTRAKTTARQVSLDIRWYDRTGAFIGTAGEANYTNTTTGWTRSTASVGSAPAEAYFAVPYIRVNGAVLGEVHYVDAVQLEASEAPTTFADARRIDVILRANRINQAINPSFETTLDNWTALNGTATRVNEGASEFSQYSAKITVTDPGEVVFGSTKRVNVIGGDQHAASAYVKGPASVTAKIQMVWYTEADSEIQLVYGEPVELLPGEWQRVTFEGLAPQNAVTAKVSLEFYDGVAGDEVYVDNVLFEKAAYVSPYFDGQTGYAQTSDLIWESSNISDSRSHYYKNREVVVDRLISKLAEFVPHGSSWAVFVAQPD